MIRILIIILFLFSSNLNKVFAQAESLKGNIISIENSQNETNYIVQLENGSTITIKKDSRPELSTIEIEKGDGVIVDKFQLKGEEIYTITDFQRTNILFLIVAVFVVLVLAIAQKKGFYSLLSLIASFFLIFTFFIDPIISGSNSIVSAIITTILVIPLNYYISHGVSKKTTYAVLSTVITIVLIIIFSMWVIKNAQLTGYTSDEAGFLYQQTKGNIKIQDLLLASIIISTLGTLDDITISQANIANHLKASKKDIKLKELIYRTFSIGRDHISSLVNTLILVYTSASLPLIILLRINNTDLLTTLNREVIIEEIIIMLITTIALVIAVPITTYISCLFIDKLGNEEDENNHIH